MFMLSLAMAATLLSPVRDPEHYYECKIERSTPLGSFRGDARISEAGVLAYTSFYWSGPQGLPKLSISRLWGSLFGTKILSGVAHFYGRRGQRVRFSFETLAGETILLTDPIRRRSGYFSHPLTWDELGGMARRAGSLRIRTITLDGSVLSEHVITAADVDQVDRDAAQLVTDLDAMVADYKNQCSSTRDAIIMIG